MATEVKTARLEETTANFDVKPIEGKAPEGAEILGGVMSRFKVEGKGDKWMFAAVLNGVEGRAKASFMAAINDALNVQDKRPNDYDRPANWQAIAKSNEPSEPESLDDLDEKTAKEYEAQYKVIHNVIDAEAKADANKRKVDFANAAKIHDVRTRFPNKEGWKQFCALAPDRSVKDYLSKNAIGAAVKSHRIRSLDGFNEDTMLSPRVTGNFGVQDAYNAALALVAGNAVDVFFDDEKRGAYTDAEGVGFALRDIVSKMAADGLFYVHKGADGDGAADGQTKPNDRQDAMMSVVIPAHVENWPAGQALITVDDKGRYVPAKTEDGDWVAGPVFGMERGDELVAAICKALGQVERQQAAQVASDVTGALASEAKAQGKPFAEWPQKLAAEHIGRILFSRVSEETEGEARATEVSDVNAILDMLGGWADEIADGADPAAVMGLEIPESDEDAEDDADADL